MTADNLRDRLKAEQTETERLIKLSRELAAQLNAVTDDIKQRGGRIQMLNELIKEAEDDADKNDNG